MKICSHDIFTLHIVQDETSMVYKFLQLQVEKPTKGDWATTCKTDLKKLKISESFEEIKTMSKNKFTKMLKMKIKENALEYLLEKKGSKGSEIDYSELEMANYLLPLNDKLKIEEKQRLFAMRNRMIEIPNNFGKFETYYCGEQEKILES